MSKYSADMAGICGLFCGTCPLFSEECDGCLSGRVAEQCVDCRHGFRTCANEKGVTRCYECGDFPCGRLEEFKYAHVENGIVHHENVIDDLRKMKEIGVQAWVDGQAEANTCAICGKLVIWHEADTHTCRG